MILGRTRREAIALLATGAALASGARLVAQTAVAPTPGPACPDLARIDRLCAPILERLPEQLLRAGLAEADTLARCDDPSIDGGDALALAIEAARSALPVDCAAATSVRMLLDRAAVTRTIRYGRNDPLAAIHRPYRVTAFSGPQLETPQALALYQPVDGAAALDAWQIKLDGFADTLLATAQALRADETAGCVPPAAASRAALQAMDAFTATPPDQHPLVASLGARIDDATLRAQATASAAATLGRRVQPAMALLRDTVAALTRAGRGDPGVWAQPDGEALHAANLARAGDTMLSPAEAQARARDAAARIGALLDRRLVARGYRTGPLAERIGAAFAAHPGFVAADDAAGRAALLEAARARIEAAHGMLARIVPPAEATTATLKIVELPDLGAGTPVGSLYIPAGPALDATLWLDDRSIYALPIPGVSPLAYHLGLPGRHLLASAAAGAPRARIVQAARWPAMTEGWGCYAERLAAETGLFAHDPWGDIARLSDELLRAARLVVDIGIHAQRWTRAQAEQSMTELTGAPQAAAIDRIVALPGEAASYTLGLDRLLSLRDAARTRAGKRFDERRFHATILAGGARPFAVAAEALV